MLWGPQMCHVVVTVGRPTSVGHLDSSCLNEEPVCSCGSLLAVAKGPAAAAEATAAVAVAAAELQRQQLTQVTRRAAERAVAVRTEKAARWAAG